MIPRSLGGVLLSEDARRATRLPRIGRCCQYLVEVCQRWDIAYPTASLLGVPANTHRQLLRSKFPFPSAAEILSMQGESTSDIVVPVGESIRFSIRFLTTNSFSSRTATWGVHVFSSSIVKHSTRFNSCTRHSASTRKFSDSMSVDKWWREAVRIRHLLEPHRACIRTNQQLLLSGVGTLAASLVHERCGQTSLAELEYEVNCSDTHACRGI
jgi:hypothetical protein